jgi:sugar-specific transcriptional regulator TrmB
MFEAIGITGDELAVYQALLDSPGSSASTIVELLGKSAREVRGALAKLETKGLVSRSPGKPPGFVPAPPDVAVEVLILRRQEELERARLAAAKLVPRFQGGLEARTSAELVEVIEGREAFGQRYLQLERGAKSELLSMDKPPYVTPPTECDEAGFEGIRRGVSYRTIYARAAFEVPGKVEAVRKGISAGELARVAVDLPVKMAIADRRLGLIPLNIGQTGREKAVLLHRSSLLDALISQFETLWELAIPIDMRFRPHDLPSSNAEGISPNDQHLMMLMASGLKDEGIARQTGLSLSTVRRRIKRFMDDLGVETRFQAGLLSAARGWFEPSDVHRRNGGNGSARPEQS